MTLRHLAWQNLRYRAPSLLGFVFAAACGAWLFFLFASLQVDSALREAMADISGALLILQVLVIAIAVVTALYALGALLRARGRELGLLQLQGMGWRDLGRLLAWETLLLGMGATLLGILIGLLTGKLWYLGLSKALLLVEPLAFSFQPVAVVQTLLLFSLLFGVAGLWSAWRLGRRPLVQLLQAESRRDGALAISWWQVALCMGAYGVAGYLVLNERSHESPRGLLGLVVALALGTYLFYVQGGVALLGWMRRRSFYWHGTNLPLLAGLGHRLRANARLLWLVTALASLTITMTGLTTGLVLQMRGVTEQNLSVDLLLSGDPAAQRIITPEQVREAMAKVGVPLAAEATITVGKAGEANGLNRRVFLSRSEWERWRAVEPDLPAVPARGILVVAEPQFYIGLPDGPLPDFMRQELPASLQAEEAQLRTDVVLQGAFLQSLAIVVPDERWAALRDSLRVEILTGWRQADWLRDARATSEVIKELDPRGRHPQRLYARGASYWQSRQELGTLFFLFSFLGLLFFLSSGAILAFRLFMEMQADKQRFARLSQIGLSGRQLTRLIRGEAAVLFLTPLLLGGVYSAGTILVMGRHSRTLLPGGLIALGVYALLQLLYLRAATVAYRRSIYQA